MRRSGLRALAGQATAWRGRDDFEAPQSAGGCPSSLHHPKRGFDHARPTGGQGSDTLFTAVRAAFALARFCPRDGLLEGIMVLVVTADEVPDKRLAGRPAPGKKPLALLVWVRCRLSSQLGPAEIRS